jgi:hypothetical protein
MAGFNRAPAYRPTCRTCSRSRRADQLLCPRCWDLVPANLQQAVLREHKPRAKQQTMAYFRAAADAVKAAETALAAKRDQAAGPSGGDRG